MEVGRRTHRDKAIAIMQTPDDIEERDGENDTSVLSYRTSRVTLVWVKSAVYVCLLEAVV